MPLIIVPNRVGVWLSNRTSTLNVVGCREVKFLSKSPLLHTDLD